MGLVVAFAAAIINLAADNSTEETIEHRTASDILPTR